MKLKKNENASIHGEQNKTRVILNLSELKYRLKAKR